VSPEVALPSRALAPRAGAARARARQEALALLDAESLIEAATAFRVWPVRGVQGERLDLGDRTLEVPGFADHASGISAVAAGACSIGPRLEQRVAELFRARRPLLALELDAVGTERLFALADRLVARIRRDARCAGLRASAELNPGDAGVALGEQHAVLALAGAEAQGIAATPEGVLRPVKSLTFVVALSRALPQSSADRCDRCGARDRCSIRPT
jgi:hypothetical protein